MLPQRRGSLHFGGHRLLNQRASFRDPRSRCQAAAYVHPDQEGFGALELTSPVYGTGSLVPRGPLPRDERNGQPHPFFNRRRQRKRWGPGLRLRYKP
jgi:hypothetical protein